MPLGAFISSGEIIDTLAENPALGHITTFGGHPVCCAAGKASLGFILDGGLHIQANNKGKRFRTGLKHKSIKNIRGEGLFLAVQLESVKMAESFMNEAIKNGLIIDQFLFCRDSFRIAPPLIINNDEIDYAIGLILQILNKINQ